MKNINIGDIYWMPALTHIDKKSVDKKLTITKIGTKYIYAKGVNNRTDYQFTVNSDGTLRLVNELVSNTAYPEFMWEKQKSIIELNKLTQKFKKEFTQINELTNFSQYQNYLNDMQRLNQRILEYD
jgi:hypothetical protein